MGRLRSSEIEAAMNRSAKFTAAVVAALPDIIPLVQANFSTIAPFIPADVHGRVLQVLALVMLILRLKTTTSLAEKGKKP